MIRRKVSAVTHNSQSSAIVTAQTIAAISAAAFRDALGRFDYGTARMVRVLQLLTRPLEFQAGWGAEIIAREAGAEFQISRQTIGHGGTHRSLFSAAVSLFGNVNEEFEVVHAWDTLALRVASVALAQRIVFSPSSMVGRSVVERLKKLSHSREVRVICSSFDEQRAYIKHGIEEDKTLLARPGIKMDAISGDRNWSLRRELGFKDDDSVLLAPGETTRAAGHREAAWTAGILSVLNRRYKLLTWGRGPLAESLNRLVKKFGPDGMVTSAEMKLGRAVDFAELPGVCDAAVFAPAGPTPPLPIAICLAAGMRIVAGPLPGLGELLAHQPQLIASRLAPRILAQRILELEKNPALKEAISQRARETAEKLFGVSVFCQTYRDAYREIAGMGSDLGPNDSCSA